MSTSSVTWATSSKRKRSDASERSPDRSSPTFADEVSADFRDALQELSNSDRYQISNLTVIANESVDPQDQTNARAIANVLIEHIKKTPPVRKLPALYVLDSIAKNVGEPYISIFSPNLFAIFFGAYSLVDPNTRKQMESMLKTWKTPNPDIPDLPPVFPLEVIRNIDTALIKYKTAAEQHRQQQSRPASIPQQAQYHQSHPPPPPPHYPSSIPGLQSQQPQQYQQLISPPPSFQGSYPPPMPQQPPMQHQQYPQTASYPYNQPHHSPAPQSPYNYPAQQAQPPQPAPNLNLASLLQNASSVTPQPQSYNSPFQQQQQPPQPPQPPAQFSGLEALLGFARSTGTSTPTNYGRVQTPQPPASTGTPIQSYLFTPPIKPATLSSVPTLINNDAKLTAASLKIKRPALLATLYGDRPKQCNTCGRRFAATAEGQARKSRHLDAHFRTNRRIAQLEESGGKGVSRSWYVEEMDWIRASEWDNADEGDAGATSTHGLAAAGGMGHGIDGQARVDGNTGNPGSAGGSAPGIGSSLSSSAGGGGKALNYIKAPVDAALVRYTCPICQDEFKAVWHDEAQEWVWMDAVKIQDKVYHGTCLREMNKDGGGVGGTPGASASSATALGVRAKMEYS